MCGGGWLWLWHSYTLRPRYFGEVMAESAVVARGGQTYLRQRLCYLASQMARRKIHRL